MPARSAVPVLAPLLRVPLGLVAGFAAVVVVLVGAMYAGHTQPGAVDRWFVLPTDDSVRGAWRGVALAIDFWGEPAGSALLITAGVAGCLLRRRPRAAALLVAGAAVAVVATTLLKYVVGRTIHGPDNLSYPSGHTAFATALAVVVALIVSGWRGLGRTAGTVLVLAVALAAGAAMGWAQVSLGAHYPTDVLAGWCTALAVVPATAWCVDRVADSGRRGRR
ncbi:phosphatase PAP2 family protein [Streptomyces sp. NPDC052225]|uniref:phosphatase PAP2 family protein n=1 Tax=Streptomyces sp. NPDC052225 TaxID=3154949 RepID=UPI00343541FF